MNPALATRDSVIKTGSGRDVEIRKGEKVFTWSSGANRDPTVFGEDAGTFRPGRENAERLLTWNNEYGEIRECGNVSQLSLCFSRGLNSRMDQAKPDQSSNRFGVDKTCRPPVSKPLFADSPLRLVERGNALRESAPRLPWNAPLSPRGDGNSRVLLRGCIRGEGQAKRRVVTDGQIYNVQTLDWRKQWCFRWFTKGFRTIF